MSKLMTEDELSDFVKRRTDQLDKEACDLHGTRLKEDLRNTRNATIICMNNLIAAFNHCELKEEVLSHDEIDEMLKEEYRNVGKCIDEYIRILYLKGALLKKS